MNGVESNTTKVLESLAADVALVAMIDGPNWNDAYQTWMAYVPGELRAVWPDLSRETRLAIAFFCDELVSREQVD